MGGDRRGSKIRFLAAAVDFCSQLQDMAKDLNDFIGNDRDGVWSDELGAALGAALRAAFDE